jgi:hypothetical protein
MSEEQQGGFFSQIKNQIITTIGIIITAAGGLVVTNMESLFGVKEEFQQIETQVENNESKKDTLVVIQKEQPKVIIKKEEPKKSETEKRKEEFDW